MTPSLADFAANFDRMWRALDEPASEAERRRYLDERAKRYPQHEQQKQTELELDDA